MIRTLIDVMSMLLVGTGIYFGFIEIGFTKAVGLLFSFAGWGLTLAILSSSGRR